MENKYDDLISEGKTEQEAFGTVISQFGDINELKEAYGVAVNNDDTKVGRKMNGLENDKKGLLRLYSIISWVDFGLIIAIVLYFFNAIARTVGFSNLFDFIRALGDEPNLVDYWIEEMGTEAIMSAFEMSGMFSVIINLAWVIVGTFAIFLTIKLSKKGYIGRGKAIFRYVNWGIFLPLDLYYLYMVLFG